MEKTYIKQMKIEWEGSVWKRYIKLNKMMKERLVEKVLYI